MLSEDMITKSLDSLRVAKEKFLAEEFDVYNLISLEKISKSNFITSLNKVTQMDENEGYLSITVTNDNISIYFKLSDSNIASTVLSQDRTYDKIILRYRIIIYQLYSLLLKTEDYLNFYRLTLTCEGSYDDDNEVLKFIMDNITSKRKKEL